MHRTPDGLLAYVPEWWCMPSPEINDRAWEATWVPLERHSTVVFVYRIQMPLKGFVIKSYW